MIGVRNIITIMIIIIIVIVIIIVIIVTRLKECIHHLSLQMVSDSGSCAQQVQKSPPLELVPLLASTCPQSMSEALTDCKVPWLSRRAACPS